MPFIDSVYVQHSPLEKLDKKHFAKPLHKGRQNGDAKATQEPDSAKQIALTEAKVKKLCNLLDEVSSWKYLFDTSIVFSLRADILTLFVVWNFE